MVKMGRKTTGSSAAVLSRPHDAPASSEVPSCSAITCLFSRLIT
jgi:hypothetical protein